MGFFDDISRKLTAVGQEAISQGSALAGSARTKMRLSDLERQLNGAYAELGRQFFDASQEAPSEEYMKPFARIKDLSAQIESCRADLRREKGVSLCPKCGAEVPLGSSFCSVCGSTIPQPAPMQQPAPYMTVKCPQCGAEHPNGTAFCTSCGTNLQDVAPTAPSAPLGAMNSNSGSISTPSSFGAPAPMNQQPAAPAPMTQQPSGFPQGGPGFNGADTMNSGFGDNAAPAQSTAHISLKKKDE